MTLVRNRLPEVRQKRNLSAATLAAQAGVTRQTIYAIEAGTYVPNTAVALRLARALEATVEDLFCLESPGARPQKVCRIDLLSLEDSLQPGQPIRLCRVGRRSVGVFSPPVPVHLPPADGVVSKPWKSGRAAIEPLRAEDDLGKRLLVAGCDPGVAVLERVLAREAAIELIAAGCSSMQALQWLKANHVHVAGSHLRDEATGESNLPVLRKVFPKGGYRVVAYATWEEGLIVAKGNPKRIRATEDLARQNVTMINREPGAGSRFLLDQSLQKQGIPPTRVHGYDQIARGHLPAAWHIYTGKADCCVGTRAAARVFGLDFLPLASERYDLVIPRRFLDLQPVRVMLDIMTRSAFRRELATLGGYDTTQTGSTIV